MAPGRDDAGRVECRELAATDHDIAHRQEEPRFQVIEALERPRIPAIDQDVKIIDDEQDRGFGSRLLRLDFQAGEIRQPIEPSSFGDCDRQAIARPGQASEQMPAHGIGLHFRWQ